MIIVRCVFFFFFQAEDGIRDLYVTGVQTVLFRSGSVLSRQSVVPSHSCAQYPTSPGIAPVPVYRHPPRDPAGASEVVPAARLQALGAPRTHACEQNRAVTVVPPEPIERQNPAQLSVPPSAGAVHAEPSGLPVFAAVAHRPLFLSQWRPLGQSMSAPHSGTQMSSVPPALSCSCAQATSSRPRHFVARSAAPNVQVGMQNGAGFASVFMFTHTALSAPQTSPASASPQAFVQKPFAGPPDPKTSDPGAAQVSPPVQSEFVAQPLPMSPTGSVPPSLFDPAAPVAPALPVVPPRAVLPPLPVVDRKSTRLNSSHVEIS